MNQSNPQDLRAKRSNHPNHKKCNDKKQINADLLQTRDLQNAQILHNRLPRESCGLSRNDDFGADCFDLQNDFRNDESMYKSRVIARFCKAKSWQSKSLLPT